MVEFTDAIRMSYFDQKMRNAVFGRGPLLAHDASTVAYSPQIPNTSLSSLQTLRRTTWGSRYDVTAIVHLGAHDYR